MDRDQLRAAQAPLKERYRSEPATATTPLRATGTFAADGITCTVESWAGPVRAGLHRATGGDGSDACSGDMLLEAPRCAGVTLRSVATPMGLTIREARLEATATFDARGTLGVDRQVAVGISGPVVRIALDTNADDTQLARLAVSTERYCVVGQSLREPVRIEVGRLGRE